MRVFGLALVMGLLATGCTHYKSFNEIKHVGFDVNTKKGKSVGKVTGEHCVFQILQYRLGGLPSLTTAMGYARTGKKSGITDSISSGSDMNIEGVRYLNNVKYQKTGFDAIVFGKDCIEVSGRGYK